MSVLRTHLCVYVDVRVVYVSVFRVYLKKTQLSKSNIHKQMKEFDADLKVKKSNGDLRNFQTIVV